MYKLHVWGSLRSKKNLHWLLCGCKLVNRINDDSISYSEVYAISGVHLYALEMFEYMCGYALRLDRTGTFTFVPNSKRCRIKDAEKEGRIPKCV